MGPAVTVEDIFDWERSTAMLAPRRRVGAGTASGYHASTRDIWWARCCGASMAVRSGASSPRRWPALGATSTSGSTRATTTGCRRHRAPPLDIDLATLDMDSVAVKTLPPGPDASWPTPPHGGGGDRGGERARQCPLVARIQAVVANGGTLDGVSLLSPSTVDLIFREQSNAWTSCSASAALRIGYASPTGDLCIPAVGARLPLGWLGGSVIIVDVERHLTIAYVMNKMAGGWWATARVQPRDRCLRALGL